MKQFTIELESKSYKGAALQEQVKACLLNSEPLKALVPHLGESLQELKGGGFLLEASDFRAQVLCCESKLRVEVSLLSWRARLMGGVVRSKLEQALKSQLTGLR